MASLVKTDTISSTTAGSPTVTLPTPTAPASWYVGRNIFINGAMMVSQRNTSVAAVTTTGYYTVDRMRLSNSSMGTWTLIQETLTSGDAYADGFQKAFRMDCTTANASPAAANALSVQCKMEGYTLQGLKKGTANAKSFTVSFWVKSNLTGNYNFFVKDRDNSRQAIQLYTINVADTWEKKTITFTGDTTGVLGCDANSSLEFWWMLGSGTDYSSGTRPTGWEAGAVWANTGVGNVNLASSTSNDWAITGVQLEVGSNATPYEHKTFGQELIACQRYYSKSYNTDVAPATSGAAGACSSLAIYSSGSQSLGARWVTSMRSAPTVVIYPTGSTNTGYVTQTSNNAEVAATAGDIGMSGFGYLSGSLPTSNANGVRFHWSADAEL